MTIEQAESSWLKKLPKRLLYTLGFMFLMLSGLYIVSSLESVQNWYGQRIAGYLSDKTGFEVKISSMQFNPWSGVKLSDVEIIDPQGQVMVSAAFLKTGFIKNPFLFIFNQSLAFNTLGIKSARLYLRRYPGETETNLSAFLKKLSGEKKGGKSCTKLHIRHVNLEDVLVEDFSHPGTRSQFSLKKAKIRVDKIDLCDQIFIGAKSVQIAGGAVEISFLREDEDTAYDQPDQTERGILVFAIEKLSLSDTRFELINHRSGHSYPEGIDFNHLLMQKMEMEAEELTFDTDLNVHARIEHLAFVEQSGLKVNTMSVDQFAMTHGLIEFKQWELETPDSFVELDAQMEYEDKDAFKNFADELYFVARVSESDLQTSDLFYFVPRLSKNQFFKDISSKHIEFKGLARGTVNNLKVNDIDLVIEGETTASGSFRARNLTIPDEALMNIRLNSFTSNTRTIVKFIPGIKVPENFHTLATLHFEGSFDGFLDDFVAFGQLQTDLGQINSDLRLQLTKGDKLSSYSGKIGLQQFNAGKLLDVPELGHVTMTANVMNGKGFDKNKMTAELRAKIDSLGFRGYVYKNFLMDGLLEQNKFNGDFSIADEHIALNFSGLIDYGKEIPVININGAAKSVHLDQLNLSELPITITSEFDIDLKGKNAKDLEGTLTVREMHLKNLEKQIFVDSAFLSTRLNNKDERYLDFTSEFLSFYFDGKYDVFNIPDAMYSLINNNFPELTEPLQYKPKHGFDPEHFYDFYVYIPDSKALLEIFQDVVARGQEITINGNVNYKLNKIDINVDIGKLSYGNLFLKDFNAYADILDDYGTVRIQGKELKMNNLMSDRFTCSVELNDQIAQYEISMNTKNKELGNFSLKGFMESAVHGYLHQIKSGNVDLYGKTWYLTENGHFIVGKNYLEVENLGLVRNDQKIHFAHMNDHLGVKAILDGFDIDLLNAVLDLNKMSLGGKAEGFILFPEIMKGNFFFEGAVRSGELLINNDPYGKMTAVIQNDLVNNDFLNITASVDNNIHRIDFDGKLNKTNKYLNGLAKIQKFPISFLEYFLQDLVTGTKGYVNGELKIFGPVKKLQFSGTGMAYAGGTKVNYLGTSYTFNEQKATVSNTYIDLTGMEVRDSKNNIAFIKGGLKHNTFKDIVFDLTIESNGFEILSTTAKDNPDYFGYAMGSLITRFTGPVDKANISVDATVFPVSHLTIPVDDYTTETGQSFIKFNSKLPSEQENSKPVIEDLGLAIEMNLTIQNGATVNIFLDEQAGDNIKGQGSGDIRLVVPRVGDIEMYGTLAIETGTYLFTAINVIQKPFSIRKGSRISWSGRVLDAELDLYADYRNESVSLSNFLSKEIKTAEELADVARKRTPADVIMHLTGSLLRPNITFDLEFPNLDAEVKSAALSKLQKLRTDQNLMYTQSVALLSLGTFLPEDDISAFDPTGLYYQYGWEFASVMISKYLTGIFEELVQNSSWITGVDVDVNFANNSVVEGDRDDGSFFPDAYGYGAKLYLFDNKASIEFAGNYVHRAAISRDKRYTNNGLIFKYYFTKDRKLRIDSYTKNDFDEINEIYRWKSGAGLNFTHEFGSIEDMKKDIQTDMNAFTPSR